jgi:hypothetical protein
MYRIRCEFIVHNQWNFVQDGYDLQERFGCALRLGVFDCEYSTISNTFAASISDDSHLMTSVSMICDRLCC